ncbi:hypothetical protein V6U90_16525 [Micromonospora sp. CPCC 206060]|uniref:hypothetical protein n=1 Tax=Micromonospora sp. CPCC 206060 TaxID=3122406 RepID=UPI002FEECD02
MRDDMSAEPDLLRVAQEYVDRQPPSRRRDVPLAHLDGLAVHLDEDYCREVADYFHQAPMLAYDETLRARYDRLKQENRAQYQVLLDAGVEVVPWQGPGQPYRNSAELVREVRRTRRLRLYLTRNGHGPRPGAEAGFHPLREPSGVVLGDVELTHNDLFRVVHDLFGHVMFHNSFGPRGEFKATYCHLHMYSDEVHPVLFTEHLGQFCWFFFGPHLRGPDGRLRQPGDPGYLPPPDRPYAEQKVFPFVRTYIDRFSNAFQIRERE